MLRLVPVLKDYIWGGHKFESMYHRYNDGKKISESWEVSVHPDGPSGTSAGETLATYLNNHPDSVDAQGNPLPVLIKFIDAAQNLSVQVHPDDEYARRVEGDNGKTEMWYIVQADEGAGIYSGFKNAVRREDFAKMVADGSVESCLNFIPVHAGDCYLIEAGTVHAIGAGCVICEIQQSSNVTYRVYDYRRLGADGKPRQLHVAKALDVINFSAFEDHTNSSPLITTQSGKERLLTECKYFCCRELLLDGSYESKNDDSFTAVVVLEGEGTICNEKFTAGDSFFIPRGETLSLQGKAKIILTNKPEWKEISK